MGREVTMEVWHQEIGYLSSPLDCGRLQSLLGGREVRTHHNAAPHATNYLSRVTDPVVYQFVDAVVTALYQSYKVLS